MKERAHKNYGLSDFIAGRKNILFITGYSASGKSTIAEDYCKKYKATYIELDVLNADYIANLHVLKGFKKELYDIKMIKFWVGFLEKNSLGKLIELAEGKKAIFLSHKLLFLLHSVYLIPF